jgi:hypothetical protein
MDDTVSGNHRGQQAVRLWLSFMWVSMPL